MLQIDIRSSDSALHSDIERIGRDHAEIVKVEADAEKAYALSGERILEAVTLWAATSLAWDVVKVPVVLAVEAIRKRYLQKSDFFEVVIGGTKFQIRSEHDIDGLLDRISMEFEEIKKYRPE